MEFQKILGMSLTTSERMSVSAVYDGTMLVIGKIEAIEGGLLQWRKLAREKVAEAISSGVSVLIEEMGDAVSCEAHGILFSDAHPTELRPMLSVALDTYFGLLNAGAIKFAPGTERCRILESAVDMSTDDKGRNLYKVDWQRVKGPHRAMLLCCLAAEGLQPITDGYFEALFGQPDAPRDSDHPFIRIQRALYEADVQKERDQQDAQGWTL